MNTKQRIEAALREGLAPATLEVIDESHLHAGHMGSRDGGETHYRVLVTSAAFEGKNRLQRHRMVNDLLAAELAGGVHALAIRAGAPGEKV